MDINLIRYNIFLCNIKLNDFKKAYEIFTHEIMDSKNISHELLREN